MQRTTLVTALVTALVFAVGGWYVGSMRTKVSILKHGHQSKDCRGNDCDVKIKIDCTDPAHPSAATCEPYADIEVALVSPGKKINFDVDTAGFEFDTDGIKFADTHIACQPSGSSGKKYKCDIAANTPVNLYKYSIRIKGLDPVDPWVVNL